jgi:ATP-dependent protease ClpP protease subunit
MKKKLTSILAVAPSNSTPQGINGNFVVNKVQNSTTLELKIIGYIGWWETSSEEFTRQVEDALRQGYTNLSLYINSEGGSVFDAQEIVNQLSRFTGTRTCKIGALCASAATIIASAFPTRIMAKNGQYMIHEGRFSWLSDCTVNDLKASTQQLENVNSQIADSYERICTIPRETIVDYMAKTEWMTASVALERGFVTAIEDKADQTNASYAANVLQSYKNVPQNLLNITPPTKTVTSNSTYKMELIQLAAALGLPANATEAQILAEIKRQKEELATAHAQLADAKATALVDAAVNAGKLPAEHRESYVAFAKTDFVKVESLLANLPTNTPKNPAANAPFANVKDLVTPALNPEGGAAPVNVEGKTLNDYSEAQLVAMERNDKPRFNELYKNTYGEYPRV